MASFSKAVSITKSDSADLPDGVCDAIQLAAAGTVGLVMANGATAALFPLAAGINYVRARRVLNTGTATAMFALYH